MKDDAFHALISALRSASWENDSIGLAEALWLARFMPRTAGGATSQDNDTASRAAGSKSHAERHARKPGGGNPPAPPISNGSGTRPSTGATQARIFSSSAAAAGDEFTPASAVRVATGAALPGALQLGRALRPLIRYRPSRFMDELDETATAESSAENQRRVTPVFRPIRERLLDVALVVDDSPSMVVWRKTVAELQSLLERHGAFRDVRRWSLKLTPKPQLVSNSGTQVSPEALLDPTGQRLIVLFTQGTHPAWGQRQLAKWLWLWGSKCPLVIAHALPESLWANTKLGEATATARTLHAAVPNTRLNVERAWWYEPDGPPTLAVPLFSLEPEAMARWAQMAMGMRGKPSPAVLFELPENIVDAPAENLAATTTSADERLSRFREHASEEAYDLACYLSQIQFTLPVMRLVQSALFGNRASQTHLAEVLLSGMVESVIPPAGNPIAGQADRGHAKPAEQATGDAEEVVYRLKADFRTLLRTRLKLDSAFSIIRALSRHIEQRLGEPIDFKALVADENGQYKLPKWARPFAVAGTALADQLGLASSARQPEPTLPDMPKSIPDNRGEGLPEMRQVRRFSGRQQESFRRIAWSGDGKLLAAAGAVDNKVRVWDAQSGVARAAMSGHSGTIYTVGWSADTSMLASGSRDETIRIWDRITGQTVHTLSVEGGAVLGLAWSPTGQTIACGTDHGRVIVWDVKARSRPLYFRHHRTSVHMVAWSPDGKKLASSSNDGSVVVASSLSGDVERRFSDPGEIYGLAWSPDGATLAYAGSGANIRLAKPDGSDIAILTGHTGAITDLSFSADGALLASISWDDTVKIWNVHEQLQIATLQVTSARRFHSGIAFHPSYLHSLAMVADKGSAIEIWQPATEQRFQELTTSGTDSEDELNRLLKALQSIGLDRALARELLTLGPQALAEQVLKSAPNLGSAIANHLRLIRAFANSGWNQLLLLRNGHLIVVGEDIAEESQSYRYGAAAWDGLIGRAARTKAEVWAPDVSLEPDYIRAAPSTAAEFAFPLLSPDAAASLLGVVNIELTKTQRLSRTQRDWLIQFCEPMAKTLAETRSLVLISYGPDDEYTASLMADDLSKGGISVSRGRSGKDIDDFAELGANFDRDASIIFLISRRPTEASRLTALKRVMALSSAIKVLPVMLEECSIPFNVNDLHVIDFRKGYAVGLAALLRTLRLSEENKTSTASIEPLETADAVRHKWHPAEDLENRGNLSPCTFVLNPNYQKRGKQRWNKWADVLVKLDDPPNMDYVYLLPSRFAPERFRNLQPLNAHQADVEQKRALTIAFSETRVGTKLHGYWFFKKMAGGERRVHVYSAEYDEVLNGLTTFKFPTASPPAAARSSIGVHDCALVVGIDAYAEYPSQSNCVASAKAFAQWLASPDGGGVPAGQVTSLFSDSERGDFDGGLMDRFSDALLQMFSKSNRQQINGRIGRRFYLYVAGIAGHAPSGGDLILLLPGASPSLSQQTMNITSYARWMVITGLFAEIIMIADCNAYANQAFEASSSFPLEPGAGLGPPSSFFFCWSAAPDRRNTDQLRPLTATILSGLASGAADRNGRVTTSTLTNYLATELSKRERSSLLPTFRTSGDVLLRVVPAQQKNKRENSATKNKSAGRTTKKSTRPKK